MRLICVWLFGLMGPVGMAAAAEKPLIGDGLQAGVLPAAIFVKYPGRVGLCLGTKPIVMPT